MSSAATAAKLTDEGLQHNNKATVSHTKTTPGCTVMMSTLSYLLVLPERERPQTALADSQSNMNDIQQQCVVAVTA